MGLALYGKHPARGDFIETGMPPEMLRALETWLDGALAEARAELGPLWERAWSAAPVWRFWLGEEVLGQAACGVMTATQDRVGRRFPLVILWTDPVATGVPPPPVIDTDQGWYAMAEAHLRTVLGWPSMDGTESLLAGLAPPAQGDGLPGEADFWAESGEDGGTLLADVALADHRRACAARSYWWTDAGRPPPPAPVAGDVFALDLPDLPAAPDDLADDVTGDLTGDLADLPDATAEDPAEETPQEDAPETGDEDGPAEDDTGEDTAAEADPEDDAEAGPEPETGDDPEEDDPDEDADAPPEDTDADEAEDDPETGDSPEADADDDTEDTDGADTEEAGDEEAAPQEAPEEDADDGTTRPPPPVEDDAWAVDADLSPFDTPAPSGGSLGALAEPVQDTGWISTGAWMDPGIPEDAPPPAPDPVAPAPPPPAAAPAPGPAPRPSRFFAGAGLPPGRILAWFLSEG